MKDSLSADIRTLQDMHRFGDLFVRAIDSVQSELLSLEPVRTAVDCIGRHWYGTRVKMVSKADGQQFYLHAGLIFLPETRIGLMIEVDKKNNLNTYQILWDELADGTTYQLNRDEAEYLKLFMADGLFSELSGKTAGEQVEALARYLKEGCEAIVRCEDRRGFTLSYQDLVDCYQLSLAFEEALVSCKNPAYRVRINRSDKDNFGQYASGYRYWLETPDGSTSLYAYFGAIYSYKKRPCGIFSEIDRFSNQTLFDCAKRHMEDDGAYDYSRSEPDFIKLFLSKKWEERFRLADRAEQRQLLTAFVDKCNENMIIAATKEK